MGNEEKEAPISEKGEQVDSTDQVTPQTRRVQWPESLPRDERNVFHSIDEPGAHAQLQEALQRHQQSDAPSEKEKADAASLSESDVSRGTSTPIGDMPEITDGQGEQMRLEQIDHLNNAMDEVIIEPTEKAGLPDVQNPGSMDDAKLEAANLMRAYGIKLPSKKKAKKRLGQVKKMSQKAASSMEHEFKDFGKTKDKEAEEDEKENPDTEDVEKQTGGSQAPGFGGRFRSAAVKVLAAIRDNQKDVVDAVPVSLHLPKPQKEDSSDEEDEGGAPQPPMGVLSSLLALQNDMDDDQASISGASTPSSLSPNQSVESFNELDKVDISGMSESEQKYINEAKDRMRTSLSKAQNKKGILKPSPGVPNAENREHVEGFGTPSEAPAPPDFHLQLPKRNVPEISVPQEETSFESGNKSNVSEPSASQNESRSPDPSKLAAQESQNSAASPASSDPVTHKPIPHGPVASPMHEEKKKGTWMKPSKAPGALAAGIMAGTSAAVGATAGMLNQGLHQQSSQPSTPVEGGIAARRNKAGFSLANLSKGRRRSGSNAPTPLTGPQSAGEYPTSAGSSDNMDYFSLGRSRSGQSSSGPSNLASGASKRIQYLEEKIKKEAAKHEARRKKAKEKQQKKAFFITQHVAEVIYRQNFLLKWARAFMMFGGPSHRFETQIQLTARVLELECTSMYLPGVLLVSFEDKVSHTSELKFIKQPTVGLQLQYLYKTYKLYYRVVHDKVSVQEASEELDKLMVCKPLYPLWVNAIIGGFAAFFICGLAFKGAFIDMVASFPLGALVVFIQLIVSKNELFAVLFEIIVAFVNAVLSGLLSQTGQLCYVSIVSSSVVLILPGFLVMCASLELGSRLITSGSVRLVYAFLYCLFLGFGLSAGALVYAKLRNATFPLPRDPQINNSSYDSCAANLRNGEHWWRNSLDDKYLILFAPMFMLSLALRNGQPLLHVDTLTMLIVGCAGYVVNYYANKAFAANPDISAAFGTFTVGVVGNVYSRITHRSAFTVMAPGILAQLPSGLSNGGLVAVASDSANVNSGDQSKIQSSLNVALSILQITIGQTIGVFASVALMSIVSRSRRGTSLATF